MEPLEEMVMKVIEHMQKHANVKWTRQEALNFLVYVGAITNQQWIAASNS